MQHTRTSSKRNDIGPYIRKVRQATKPPVSQEDLSGRLARQGIMLDRSAISRIENQDRCVLDYEAMAIATSLHIKLTVLYGEE